MTIVWLVLVVVFLIAEGASAGLTSIWFAAGALAALVAALLSAAVWLQLVLFVAVSAAALLATRPLVRKYVDKRIERTNADRLVGEQAAVREKIDKLAGTGAVFAGGKLWSARSVDTGTIEEGALVVVRRIEGVKLMVEPVRTAETTES
ncbi:MAG: NfeD family protein [Oscillospiraceae bacterium]|nr:NfeD family protein [Oscillospiraceae bacterium]